MVYLVSIFPIPDYDVWKVEFDQGIERRRLRGVTRHWVYRGADDPNEVMLVLELPSLERARELLAAPEGGIRAWMDRIGLEIYPTFFVGEQTEEIAYTEAPDAAPTSPPSEPAHRPGGA